MDRRTARLMEQQLAEAIRLHLPTDLGLVNITTREGGAPTEVLVTANGTDFVVTARVAHHHLEDEPF